MLVLASMAMAIAITTMTMTCHRLPYHHCRTGINSYTITTTVIRLDQYLS